MIVSIRKLGPGHAQHRNYECFIVYSSTSETHAYGRTPSAAYGSAYNKLPRSVQHNYGDQIDDLFDIERRKFEAI